MEIKKLTTIYHHTLSEEKREIDKHSAQCEDCNRFFFKTDLRLVFIDARRVLDERLLLCTRCRGKRSERIHEATSEAFGVAIPVVKVLDKCFKSSKRNSDKTNGRKAHSLCLDDVIRLWILQEGKCNLSGVQMSVDGDDMEFPSIDRIDSAKSYVMGNVQLVTIAVNMMKGPLPQVEFQAVCRQISRHRKKMG